MKILIFFAMLTAIQIAAQESAKPEAVSSQASEPVKTPPQEEKSPQPAVGSESKDKILPKEAQVEPAASPAAQSSEAILSQSQQDSETKTVPGEVPPALDQSAPEVETQTKPSSVQIPRTYPGVFRKLTHFYEVRLEEITKLEKRAHEKAKAFFEEMERVTVDTEKTQIAIDAKSKEGGKENKKAIKGLKAELKSLKKQMNVARKQIRSLYDSLSEEIAELSSKHLGGIKTITKESVKALRSARD